MRRETYTVRRGDTLSSIAKLNGCAVADLKGENSLADPNRLSVGQVLQLPRMRALNPGKAGGGDRKQGEVPASHAPITSRQGLETFWNEAEESWNRFFSCWHDLSDQVLQPMRQKEAEESVQLKDKAPMQALPDGSAPQPTTPPKTNTPVGSTSQRSTTRDEVLRRLKERLDVTPKIVVTNGTTLSRNERKFIVAGVGLCEIDKDVFGTRNPDTEFVGRKFGKKGAETSYSRILHLGLSYGYIQFTQDSGNLGILLQRMRAKNKGEFDRIFGGTEKSTAIPDQLIELTTSGLRQPDGSLPKNPSGQQVWQGYSPARKKELQKLASQDEDHDGKPDLPESEVIRGARVQKIPFKVGSPPLDLWDDDWLRAFSQAGRVEDFQDVQLDFAVEGFLNPILSHCRENRIRSAKGLAFVTACRVRGANRDLLIKVAQGLGYTVPFKQTADEFMTLNAIATAEEETVVRNGKSVKRAKAGDVSFDLLEKHRAAILKKDEFRFLAEDFYDPDSFDNAHDK